MRVLVGCECSGVVRDAFIARGHDAWSCDLKPTEKPGPHLQCDVLTVLDMSWDLAIFHPDCTYLTCSAEWAYGDGPYHQKVKPDTLVGAARREARKKAVEFAEALWNSGIPRIALENPVGVLSRTLGKPQVIQPYNFGENASKATCLWLKNLPPLKHTSYCLPRIVVDKSGRPRKRWSNQTDSGQNRLSPSESRSEDRSRTYPGIARAMAEQWGTLSGIRIVSEQATESESRNTGVESPVSAPREQHAFRVYLPADCQNPEYRIRHLIGGDMGAELLIEYFVLANLTPEQKERLLAISPQDLKDLRNGPNAVSVAIVKPDEFLSRYVAVGGIREIL